MNCSRRFSWNIVFPTYKRPDILKKSFAYLFKDFDNAWCACTQAEAASYGYMKNILIVPDEIEGRLARKNNYILSKLWPEENQFIILMDDDQKGFSWVATNEGVNPEEFVDLIEFDYEVATLVGAGIFGMLTNGGLQTFLFSIADPFSFQSFIDGTSIAIRDRRLKYDEKLHMRQDIDLNLQNLKLNGVTVKDCRWMLNALTRHGLGEGGDRAHQVVSSLEEDRVYLLQKWKNNRHECMEYLKRLRYAAVGGKVGGY